ANPSASPASRLLGSIGREGAIALSSVLAGVRKYWPTVVAAAILGAGTALLISRTVPCVYDATALVELNAIVTRPLGSKGEDMTIGNIGWWDNQEYYETQYRIVTSERVLVAVARNLNLTADAGFFGLRSLPAKGFTVDDAAGVLRGRVRVDPYK